METKLLQGVVKTANSGPTLQRLRWNLQSGGVSETILFSFGYKRNNYTKKKSYEFLLAFFCIILHLLPHLNMKLAA